MDTVRDYFYYAENDYLFAKSSFENCVNDYNVPAYILAQSGEKYLKAIIEHCPSTTDSISILKSHNMRSLYNYVKTYHTVPVSSKDCKWLGDFYFDARYPGEDSVVVTRDDVLECLDIVESLRKFATDLLSAPNDKDESIKEDMHKYALSHTCTYEQLCGTIYSDMPTLLKTGDVEKDAIVYWEKWKEGK